MRNVLPVGTVIKLKGQRAMIVGYDYREVNERLELHYLLIPHPSGYTKPSDIRVIIADGIEVVELGYLTKASILLERYFANIQKIADLLPANNLLSALDEAVRRKQQEVEK